MWDYFSFLLQPWFIPLCLLSYAFYYLYTDFDPLSGRHAQPQNISHYQLPQDKKPSSAVSDDHMMYMYCSATELGRFLREKRITSTNLVKKYVERLLHANSSINAAVNYRFSQAFDEAIICDEIIAQLSSIYLELQLLETGSALYFDLSHYEADKYPMLLSLFKNTTAVTSLSVSTTQNPQTSQNSQTSSQPQVILELNHKELQNDMKHTHLTHNLSLHIESKQETLYHFLTRYLPPFFGVPCTTKECFALKGMPHTSGLVSRRAAIANYTAPVVLNMQYSGLVIIATSNTSELCMWMESANQVYGQTRNPYNLKRTPGGSSGGEAALLASLSTPISLGSDVGGSIRMPAFFNGIYGHKPTSNYVSCLGQVPSSRGGIPDSFCQAGPMARYPADLWPFLQTMVQTHTTTSTQIGPQPHPLTSASSTTTASNKTVLNLTTERGNFGEHRTLNLLPRPTINKVDVPSLNAEYATSLLGETIIDPTYKHFHNPHGISGRYQQEPQQRGNFFFSDSKQDKQVADAKAVALNNNIDGPEHVLLIDQPSENVAFLPYPHQSSRYYEYNSLKQYTQEDYPLLTSSHPSQVYPTNVSTNSNPTTIPSINTLTPYQIDPTKIVVYSLRTFGTSPIPVSAVDPILIQKQLESAQFLANMGCTVYEIDVDQMIQSARPPKITATGYAQLASKTPLHLQPLPHSGIAQLQRDPNFFIPQAGNVQITSNTPHKPVPLPVEIQQNQIPGVEVFQEFVNAFEYWSAGMTLTYSAFRELLLQDCTVESMDYVKKNQELKLFHQQQRIQKDAILREQELLQFNKQQRDMMIFNANNNTQVKHIGKNENSEFNQLEQQQQQQQPQSLKSDTPMTTTCDPLSESSVDFTSYEELSKHTILHPDVVKTLPLHFLALYYIMLTISTLFHYFRRMCITLFLPLDGIPFFGEVEGAIEVKRQNNFFDFLIQQRQNVADNRLAAPSVIDIHPPMALSHVLGKSMPIFQRIYFEARVAGYILYHLCLSLCSRQLVPTGTQCLAQLQGETCWHDLQPLPSSLATSISPTVTPSSSSDSLLGLNSIVSSSSLKQSPLSTFSTASAIRNDFTLVNSSTSPASSSLHSPNLTPRPITSLPSLSNPHSHELAKDFQKTTYQAYLYAKSYYPHCNCSHVLQSAKQTQILTKKHNITILQLISSFLPATPYTFPALLLGLIDRVGDLTPSQTLSSFSRCLKFSQSINQLLAPSPSQPFGAVILAPPHPKQAPAHFMPCTKPFNFVYTGIFNATMTPVTSVPLGLHKNLPTGIQVVGARHCDATTISMALLLHEQFGGWQPAKRLHSKYFVDFK